ncbi:hypothetical protein J4558_00060 [Leptolyngbya sp. 15MV]|nr:hypothetical protein J4558_00060 [Leptolyngbya sp. 15MV]
MTETIPDRVGRAAGPPRQSEFDGAAIFAPTDALDGMVFRPGFRLRVLGPETVLGRQVFRYVEEPAPGAMPEPQVINVGRPNAEPVPVQQMGAAPGQGTQQIAPAARAGGAAAAPASPAPAATPGPAGATPAAVAPPDAAGLGAMLAPAMRVLAEQVVNINAGREVVQGAAGDALQNLINTVGDVLNLWREAEARASAAGAAVTGGGDPIAAMRAAPLPDPVRLPEVPRPPRREDEGMVAGLARDLGSFGLSMAAVPARVAQGGARALGQLARPLGAFGRRTAEGATMAVRGAAADFTRDPTEDSLARTLAELGVAEDFMRAIDPTVEDDATAAERLRGRLGTAAEGAALGALIDVALTLRRAVAERPALMEAVRRALGAATLAGGTLAADEAEGNAALRRAVQTVASRFVHEPESQRYRGFSRYWRDPPPLVLPPDEVAAVMREADARLAAEPALLAGVEGIRVFHGSPTRGIREFLLRAIGSGEGNQAFAWGLYFAEVFGVARSYREGLTADRIGREAQRRLDEVKQAEAQAQAAYLRAEAVFERMFDLHHPEYAQAVRDSNYQTLRDAMADRRDLLDEIETLDFGPAYNDVRARIDELEDLIADLRAYRREAERAYSAFAEQDGAAQRLLAEASEAWDQARQRRAEIETETDMRISASREAMRALDKANGDPDAALAILRREWEGSPDLLERAEFMLKRERDIGGMYEVNLAIDPARLLEWDIPLQGQSAFVQERLARLGIHAEMRARWQVTQAGEREKVIELLTEDGAPLSRVVLRRDGDAREVRLTPDQFNRRLPTGRLSFDGVEAQLAALPPVEHRMTGRDAYDALVGSVGQRNASMLLGSMGIQGVRYLDGMSRRGRGDDHNIVVWDERLISIVRQYGLAPLMITGVAAAATGGQDGS